MDRRRSIRGQAVGTSCYTVAPPGAIAGYVFQERDHQAPSKTRTVDDFIAAMGVMSGALGWDCADCHPGAGTDTVDWVFDTRVKRTARRMVEMVDAINKAQFAGVQKAHVLDVPSRPRHPGELDHARQAAMKRRTTSSTTSWSRTRISRRPR